MFLEYIMYSFPGFSQKNLKLRSFSEIYFRKLYYKMNQFQIQW